MDDGLDDHGGGVDPGQSHEEGEGSGDGDDEPVLDIAGVGHLLDADPRQGADVDLGLLRDDRVLHHVLQVGKAIVEVLEVNPRSPPGTSPAQSVLVPLSAVHLEYSVKPDGQRQNIFSVATLSASSRIL